MPDKIQFRLCDPDRTLRLRTYVIQFIVLGSVSIACISTTALGYFGKTFSPIHILVRNVCGLGLGFGFVNIVLFGCVQ